MRPGSESEFKFEAPSNNWTMITEDVQSLNIYKYN
jgi:hypothetical protein